MKVLARVACGLAGGVLVASGAAIPANAASLYDNINYSGFMETRTSGTVGPGFNDRTTSFTNSGGETYCENVGCSGRKVYLSGSYNDLRAVNTGLGFGETWSDRISALQ